MSAHLSIKDLHLSYGSVDVLHGVNLEIAKGDIVALTGASGCGKTSVLRCIAGLERPSKGVIYCAGHDISTLPTEKRNVGLIFQGNALFPHMSVAKNLGFGLHSLSKAERQTHVNEMLSTLDLKGFGDRSPHELSGGQQQRVAIGRSLISKPDVLLMDEPFSDLDKETKSKVREAIRSLLNASQITTIIVSHHADDVESMAKHVYEMKEGKLI